MRRTFSLSFIICASLMISVFADSGITNCNRFWSYLDGSLFGGKYVGNIQFIPSHVIESGEGFYLEEGKQVKQAYIVLQRVHRFSKETIYNSGRRYTPVAADKYNTDIHSVSDSIKRTLHLEKIYYGWVYW